MSFSDPTKCHNLVVLNPQIFNPIRAVDAKQLFLSDPAPSPEIWEKAFAGSKAIHFYSFGSKKKNVSGDPRLDAYSYLGPKFCPTSFQHIVS